MTPFNIFRRHAAAPQKVTTGRFEIEHKGEIAYLEYTMSDKVLGLIHTEVPEHLRGQGVASELAQHALDFAREHHLKVDIVCPLVHAYVAKHSEYADVLM
jgi:predicted GNAT family acetyltransferase